MTDANQPAHHISGPSASEGWLTCPAYPSVQAQYADQETSSSYADEGSAAHELADWVLSSSEGVQCEDFLGELAYTGEDGTEYYVDEDMVYYVQEYVDYVRGIHSKVGGDLYVENRVSIDRIVPGGFGTSDAIIVTEDTIHVIDLKYGKGIKVHAFHNGKPNSQALCYALGAFDEHDFGTIENIKVAIVQPRLDHISEYELTVDELEEWVEYAHGQFLKTMLPDPERIPGQKSCQWCSGKHECKAFIDMNLQTIVDDFSEFDDSIEALENGDLLDANSKTVTVEQLVTIFEHKSAITSLLGAVTERLTNLAKLGEDIPSHKLAMGNKKRVFKDDEKAKKAFARKIGLDGIAPRQMLTVPQLEKLKFEDGTKVKGSRLFNSHVDVLDGNPILVHESSKREEYVVTPVEEDFEDFDSDEDFE